MNNYVFWVETLDGTYLQWTRLTLRQAKQMCALTDMHQPDHVARYGWEEMK